VTPAQIILEARRILQDVASPQRYVDAILLGFCNQAIKRMAILRPDIFAVIGEIPTVAGTVLQSTPADSVRLMEIFSVKDGHGVTEVNRKAMDQNYPQWVSDPAGPTVNWMRHPRNANKFFVYPKAPADQVLIGEYTVSPPDYNMGDEIDYVPNAYYPVLVDGVVFLAESVDDEHVNNNRAQMYQQMFTQALGVSLDSRIATDTDDAGLGKGALP
jgi:hypothetical protein